MRCGVVDSIRTCLENRGEMNDKMLKLLVQSFERIKKPIQTTHTAHTRKSNRNKNSFHFHKTLKKNKISIKTRQIMENLKKKNSRSTWKYINLTNNLIIITHCDLCISIGILRRDANHYQ